MYKFFGFAIEDSKKPGSYIFYHFTVLPFGAVREIKVNTSNYVLDTIEGLDYDHYSYHHTI